MNTPIIAQFSKEELEDCINGWLNSVDGLLDRGNHLSDYQRTFNQGRKAAFQAILDWMERHTDEHPDY